MVLATLIGSSLGATLAYSFKKRDSFHLVDLMAREMRTDSPKQMAEVYKAMKEAYEKHGDGLDPKRKLRL